MSISSLATATIPEFGASAARPRLLIVTHEFVATSQVWLWRQVQYMRTFAPHIVCWTRCHPELYPFDETAITHVPFPAVDNSLLSKTRSTLANWPRRTWWGTWGAEREFLRGVLARVQPAAILCHFGHFGLRLLPLTQETGIPLVVHFHGNDLSSMVQGRGLRSWYRASLLRHVNDFAAGIVVGTHQREWLVQHGADPAKLNLIPCGVPTGEYELRAGSAGGPARLIAVSRLDRDKGVDLTLQAFAIVHRQRSDVRLTVVGDGTERLALIEQAKQAGLGAAVTFTGPLPATRVRTLLGESDIFVQHSIARPTYPVEGFGVSLAEAAACGLPVVSTISGGIPDQVLDGETGLLVREGDVSGMAAALLRLVDDPSQRQRLGRAGRERMRTCFDTVTQVRKLEQVCQQAAGLNAPAAG